MGAATREAPGDEAKPSGFCLISLALEGEAHRVLADRDQVAVRQLLLYYRLAVDQRAVRASQVADPESAVPHLDPTVVTRGCGISDDDVVVGGSADAHHLARQRHHPARERS